MNQLIELSNNLNIKKPKIKYIPKKYENLKN